MAYPEALVGKLNKNIRKVSIGLLVTGYYHFTGGDLSDRQYDPAGDVQQPFSYQNHADGGCYPLVHCQTAEYKSHHQWRYQRCDRFSALLYILILIAEGQLDWLKTIHDTGLLILLFFILIIVGIGITLFSTHRSVIKYLRMKLDDLY